MRTAGTGWLDWGSSANKIDGKVGADVRVGVGRDEAGGRRSGIRDAAWAVVRAGFDGAVASGNGGGGAVGAVARRMGDGTFLEGALRLATGFGDVGLLVDLTVGTFFLSGEAGFVGDGLFPTAFVSAVALEVTIFVVFDSTFAAGFFFAAGVDAGGGTTGVGAAGAVFSFAARGLEAAGGVAFDGVAAGEGFFAVLGFIGS